MSDHQKKIHPIAADNVEAPAPAHSPPSAPLIPHGSRQSEKGDPAVLSQPRPQSPPLQRTIPVSYLKPPKKRSCCCRCLCWTVSILLLLVVAVAATAGILFLVFRPKLPKYSIDGLRITRFNLGNDDSLSASFNINVTARNRNKKIGIYYRGGSRISAFYAGKELCRGSFPEFYQGRHNTTVIDVPMAGQTQNATGLLTELQEQQQQAGSVQLNLKAKVPVKIKLGKLKLPKITCNVRCRLKVASLTAADTIKIESSSCKFRFKL